MKCVIAAVFAILTGCASTSQGPGVLLIEPLQYAEAFDAAAAVVSADGMKPSILDRRSGYIHTDPTSAGSIMEPWKPRASSPRQSLENTLALQRRTVRFEFRPAESNLLPERPMGELLGPELLSGPGVDLTTFDGLIELRVWVFVERQYKRGVRRGTWTLTNESMTKELPADPLWEQTPSVFWTPMTRDVAREREILAGVESLIKAE